MILFSAILSFVLYTCVTEACPAECTCTGTNVDCSSKGLTSVPTGIPAQTRNLTLASNQICRIENNSFRGLTALQYLFLENNQLSKIDDRTFILLPNLKTLFLSSNQISRIERETFAGLSNVQSLYLDSNKITGIDDESFTSNGMFYIQYLNLNNNDITTIDNKTFVGLRANLKSLSIEGNPFHCDCVLAGFVEFMSGFVIQSNAKCATPEKLKGTYVRDLTFSMVCSNQTTGSTLETTKGTRETGTAGFTTATTREPKTGSGCSFNEDAFIASLVGNGLLFPLVVILVCVLGKLLRNKRNQASRYVNFERDCADSGRREHTEPKVVRVGSDGYLEPYNHYSNSKNHSINTRNQPIASRAIAFARNIICSDNNYDEID